MWLLDEGVHLVGAFQLRGSSMLLAVEDSPSTLVAEVVYCEMVVSGLCDKSGPLGAIEGVVGTGDGDQWDEGR